MKQKNCMQCGCAVRGRSDKKFCSDACRTYYNNILKADNDYVKLVNKILRKNRFVLEKIYATNAHTPINKNMLIDLGYNINYYTHARLQGDKVTAYFCYEFGICYQEQEFIKLIKQDNPIPISLS